MTRYPSEVHQIICSIYLNIPGDHLSKQYTISNQLKSDTQTLSAQEDQQPLTLLSNIQYKYINSMHTNKIYWRNYNNAIYNMDRGDALERGDVLDRGDTFERNWQAWQKFLVFTDFTTLTATEFKWLTNETIHYWPLTSVTTNLLIPYFTESEITCWSQLKLRSINKFVPANCALPAPR